MCEESDSSHSCSCSRFASSYCVVSCCVVLYYVAVVIVLLWTVSCWFYSSFLTLSQHIGMIFWFFQFRTYSLCSVRTESSPLRSAPSASVPTAAAAAGGAGGRRGTTRQIEGILEERWATATGDRSDIHDSIDSTVHLYTVLYCTILHYTVLTTLHCTILHYTVPFYTIQNCMALYCTALYNTASHWTTLRCTSR